MIHARKTISAIKKLLRLLSCREHNISQPATPARCGLGFFESLVITTGGNKLMGGKELIKTKIENIEPDQDSINLRKLQPTRSCYVGRENH